MRLLDRYLLRELLVPLGYCLGGFLIFSIAFDLIGHLNNYQEHKLLFSDVLEIYIVKIPELLVLILPVVLLLALLYALTNHARHHEITAIRAAGISLWRICVPYLAVGFLLSFALFAMNEYWVPNSAQREKDILDRHTREPGSSTSATLPKFSFNNQRDGRLWTGDLDLTTHTISAPNVHWKLADGTSRLLMAHHADYLNGSWTFFGSPFFSPLDITNAPALANKLKKPRNDTLAQYLGSQLSPSTHYLLFNSTDGTNIDLAKILAEDFNRIIQKDALYEPRRFAGVHLSPEAAALIDRDLHGTNLIWLNRVLLFDAYPRELSKGRSFNVSMWKTSASNTDQRPLLYTNILILPEFSETPEQMRRDYEFNNRIHGSAVIQYADIPVYEIVDYLRLHPDLDSQKRSYLATQLYGRLAAPWTCVVVVLIAIPFSAASGRRNAFVGVAASIVICFVYFVLLKLSLVLGVSGILPGWFAAWLPNATFGIAGIWMMLRVR